MFKKWHSCVLSVLCLCCMSFMLFSNTLVVKAAPLSQSFSQSFKLYASGGSSIGSGSGYISSGTGSVAVSISPYDTGYYHIAIPVNYKQSTSNWHFDYSGVALLNSYINYYGIFSFPSISVSNVMNYDIKNVVLCDKNHVPILSSNGYTEQRTVKGNQVFDASLSYVNWYYYFEFDIGFQHAFNSGDLYANVSITGGQLAMDFRNATADEIDAATIEVTDAAANESLNAIEQSSQDIATSVTSDTGGGLLATIKNFFGGFFSNLINSILGLFVPDSTYFSTWFNNLNTLLSDKLGMLYAPFDLLISTLNAIYSADTTEPGITFPGITWNGETVIEPYTFYFSSLGEDFQNLRDAVYFGTDVVLLFAFLHLLQKKIALVITGSEVNG